MHNLSCKSSCVKTAAEPCSLCFAYDMGWYPAEVRGRCVSREGSGGYPQAAVAGPAGNDEEHGPGIHPKTLICSGMALS